MQWVHYTKTCSSSAHGAYLSAETYKPIKDNLTWDVLEADCDNWGEYINEDHLVGHGGSSKFLIVETPPMEWINKEINKTIEKITEKNNYLKLLQDVYNGR